MPVTLTSLDYDKGAANASVASITDGTRYYPAGSVAWDDGGSAVRVVSLTYGLPIQPGTGAAFPATDNGGSLTVDAPVGTPVFVRLSDGTNPISTLPVQTPANMVGGATLDNDGPIMIIGARDSDSGISVVLSGTSTGALFVTGSGGTFPVTDSGGSLTVDNAGTFAVNLSTAAIDNAGTSLTPKFAAISASSSGNNTIVPAVTSKKIRVLAYNFIGAGAVNAKFQSGASGTDLTGLKYIAAAGGGICAPFNPLGWFETGSGVLLNLNLSGAVAVGGELVYVEV